MRRLAFEPRENRPARRVDERGKCPVEPFAIVHHIGKYRLERLAVNLGIFAPISLRTGGDVDIRHQSQVVKRVAFWQSPA